MTSYIQRLGRLEKLAVSVAGVQQAFAIQAGREIRVVVSPSQVTDDQRPRDRQGAAAADRDGIAVSQHDPDHGHPGKPVHRDGELSGRFPRHETTVCLCLGLAAVASGGGSAGQVEAYNVAEAMLSIQVTTRWGQSPQNYLGSWVDTMRVRRGQGAFPRRRRRA